MQATRPDPLPRGRHGLKPEEVAAHQRERIAYGIAKAVAEHGYGALTVEQVIEVAGVSRSTFYAHFDSKLEAVLASHELIFERFLSVLTAGCPEDAWPAKVREAIGATLAFASAWPDQFQILSTGSLTVNEALAGRVFESFRRLGSLLAGVRLTSPHRDALPDCTEEFLVGGVALTVSGWLAQDQALDQDDLQRQLVELTLIPYYGRAKAARLSQASR